MVVLLQPALRLVGVGNVAVGGDGAEDGDADEGACGPLVDEFVEESGDADAEDAVDLRGRDVEGLEDEEDHEVAEEAQVGGGIGADPLHQAAQDGPLKGREGGVMVWT